MSPLPKVGNALARFSEQAQFLVGTKTVVDYESEETFGGPTYGSGGSGVGPFDDPGNLAGIFTGVLVPMPPTKVINTTCEPEKCEVRMELTINNPMVRRADDTLTTNFSETWLQEGGRWYHYEKP